MTPTQRRAIPTDMAASVSRSISRFGHRHAHGVEDQLGREGRSHAQLVLPLLAQREALHALLDQEGAEALIAGHGVDHEGVAQRPLVDSRVGNEGLAPVEHVGVAVASRLGLHGEHVGSSPGLRHAEPADLRPRGGLGEEALLLQVVAVDVQVLGEEDRVGQHGQGKAGIRARKPVEEKHRRCGIQPRSSVGVGEGHPQQAELSRLQEEPMIEALAAIVLAGLGLHLAGHECVEAVPKQGVL
jgi:hypothetical protein